MRILILSQYYDPEPIPKPSELARELKDRGHEVCVVTGFPNYPSGNLYPGSKLRLIQQTEQDGISVTRTFEYPYHGKSALGRILNYVSFMVSAPLGLFKAGPCEVIYVWSPPLTVGIAAWIMARIRRVPFVYDVQDIWPESAILSGVLTEGLLTKFLSRIEKFVYRRANHLLVVTEGARENLVMKGVPSEKISVMRHWINEGLFKDVEQAKVHQLRQELNFNDRFIVLFAGNLGLIQSLDTVVLAADILRGNEKVLIVFVGDGSDKPRLQNLTRRLNLENKIWFLERQPMENMPALMAASDVLLAHLKRSDLSPYIIPTKLISYLAAGKPVLLAAEGAAVDLINQAEAGIIADPENPSAMAEAICTVADFTEEDRSSMGQHGRDYYLSHFSKNVVIPLYEALLQGTINSKRKSQ